MPAFLAPPPTRPATRAACVLALWGILSGPMAHAAQTSIADEPMIQQAELRLKPNLLVILDDSSSMTRDYMPDNAQGWTNRFGHYSPQCNGVAYDPAISYAPPVKADGSSYPHAVFTAALTDGFDAASAPVDLSTMELWPLDITTTVASAPGAVSFTFGSSNAVLGPRSFVPGSKIYMTASSREIEASVDTWAYDAATEKGTLTIKDVTRATGTASRSTWSVRLYGQHYFRYLGLQPKMAYAYDASGALQRNTFFNECDKVRAGSTTATNGKVFEHNLVTAQSPAAVQTNYANWYSYYRTRHLLMRSSMGHALNPLNDSSRLGFMTINKQGARGTSSASFRPVSDFNAQQKTDFYSSLYVAPANGGGTPLQGALAHAGRYFAKNLTSPTQATDPMQHACQRNYALLTTDGYWNGSFSNGGLGNTVIGDVDADGATTSNGNTTLADIAHYYYRRDLRPDYAGAQHMTTFTIGLGITGTLPQPTIPAAWPSVISADNITTADDLWHASVNGGGAHYSAKNATELGKAIQGIVTAIENVIGAGSATATSTLDLVQGENNIAFEASYTTGAWTGDVVAREIDAITAMPKAGPPLWSARAKLDAVNAARRRIYFRSGSVLSEFTWDHLDATLKAHFQNACSAIPAKLTQCAALSEANRTSIDSGPALVNYLRGDQTHETTNAAAPLFRERLARLGNIVNSKPIHVGQPPFDYGDAGYAQFKAAQAARRKVLYFGANDGMLHALDAGTGEELWAYIPTPVMPNLHKLADVRYGRSIGQPHAYFVDGKAVQGDVKIGNEWKTILVGGLNKGGRAYYALDITNPDEPRSLWEFAHGDGSSHNNLGLSYSDPVISKLANGTWTVAFASGYNNVSPGDGKGRLFVVNAATGAIERDIATPQGSTDTPSGLAKINVWRKSSTDNTAQRFYGGDLQGNLWRFDVDGLVQPHNAALRLAQMQDASGKPQPITTEPKLREYDRQSVIAIATGRYLGREDIEDRQVQSVAAIRDPLQTIGWGSVRENSAFRQVTIGKSGAAAHGNAATVDWPSGAGWWADFPTQGERVALPMEWDGPRLLAATTLPDGDQCKSGGSSWLYSFGLAGGVTHGEQFSDSALIVGFSVVTNAKGAPKILVRTSSNETTVRDGTGLGGAPIVKPARRVSWRELH